MRDDWVRFLTRLLECTDCQVAADGCGAGVRNVMPASVGAAGPRKAFDREASAGEPARCREHSAFLGGSG